MISTGYDRFVIVGVSNSRVESIRLPFSKSLFVQSGAEGFAKAAKSIQS